MIQKKQDQEESDLEMGRQS